MSRWFDAPDGWKDRVQSVVCQVFGCACADPDNHSRPATSQRPPAVASPAFSSRAAAVAAPDADDPDPDSGGEAQPCSAWAGAALGVAPMTAPADSFESGGGGVRRRRFARSPERVGVVVRAAPTTRTRDDPAA